MELLVIFFSIQRAYGTLKQNLVKFKYLKTLTKKLTHLVTLNGTEDANL